MFASSHSPHKLRAVVLTHLTFVSLLLVATYGSHAEESGITRHWLWSKAHAVPYETTSEQSGYFSLIEGHNGRIYIGTAKYGENAFLVEFDPNTEAMKVVVDCHKEIGTTAKGFAAQAKIHTRNNVGRSGKIYFATKQGYPKDGEKRTDYLGGYPMVYDPATGKTKVYDIPIKHQGVISIAPDESRGVAYISTCSDERPVESAHFMILDLETGKYRDLLDTRHMYAFIAVDYLGRAYHPVLGGEIARYDPRSDKLTRLQQTIDGKPLSSDDADSHKSLLAHPKSHPINWDLSPDRKTLYSVAMSGNQLFAYDLTAEGDKLAGRSLGSLIPDAEKTDCRALCVGPDGTVWAGVAAKFKDRGSFLHLVSYQPGGEAPIDHGPIAIGNPNYTQRTDDQGEPLKFHHGIYDLKDGTLVPRFHILGICAAADGTVYVTTLCPFTLHAIRIPKVAGLTTEYRHNSHADVILGRILETDELDGTGQRSSLQLASLHTDQLPENDMSRKLAKNHGVPIEETIAGALTDESKQLDVDGVVLVAEHGKYPNSKTGQKIYPKLRMFGQIAAEFERTGKVVPVFSDKHLADNWTDAKWIYDTAKRLNVPMMAGSSLPGLWRDPPADVKRGAKLKNVVALSYSSLDSYGFHALEMVQCLVERRAGGETGVAKVQTLTGPAVWKAADQGVYDRALLDETLKRVELRKAKSVEELVREPILCIVDYRDGLRVCVFTLNGAVADFAATWQYEDGSIESTRFDTQDGRPFHHFTYLLMGIEKMMHTGKPTWPVERTLLTSGVLDALHRSIHQDGEVVKTPWLDVRYQSEWNWQQPPSFE